MKLNSTFTVQLLFALVVGGLSSSAFAEEGQTKKRREETRVRGTSAGRRLVDQACPNDPNDGCGSKILVCLEHDGHYHQYCKTATELTNKAVGDPFDADKTIAACGCCSSDPDISIELLDGVELKVSKSTKNIMCPPPVPPEPPVVLNCPKAATFPVATNPQCFAAFKPPTTATRLVLPASGEYEITQPGYYIPDNPSLSWKRLKVQSSDVTIDGFSFNNMPGPQVYFNAIVNSAAGLKNIAILNNEFTGYVRPINFGAFGGPEGVPMNVDRGSNFLIQENHIVGLSGTNPTAIMAFNIDGLTLKDNVIDLDPTSAIGRRGFNIDSSSDVLVDGNTLNMGGDPAGTVDALASTSTWAIQLAMSNKAIANIQIINNVISGTRQSIIGLSKFNLDNVQISCNDIQANRPMTFNTGNADPPVASRSFTNIVVTDNTLTKIGTTSTNPIFSDNWALGLLDYFAGTPVSRNDCCVRAGQTMVFDGVTFTNNIIDADFAVDLRTYPNPDMTYNNIISDAGANI